MSENNLTSRRISVDLPNNDIERLDQLKREWGLRGRGDVLKRLLEEILPDNQDPIYIQKDISNQKNINSFNSPTSRYNENKALVLIKPSNKEPQDIIDEKSRSVNSQPLHNENLTNTNNKGIDLPGFVSKRTYKLKTSLSNHEKTYFNEENVINTISYDQVNQALKASIDHWLTLYGNEPKDNVIEAAMLWLARDIWPGLENTDGLPFTWSAANRLLKDYCPFWKFKKPSLESIIVIAGLLEDPFSAETITSRIPTLIRRFVNKFKRNKNVTSFQTLESTMTVHGALKLLDLPTQAGASLTLSKVRDSYKSKAMEVHPDSGGSTESMRRVNEAYQLLKDLYRTQD
ncbi:molecular chaperone DnaJ [Prochlorococcus sp. MIT 1307]|uniref:J domain-containing protein n=1 Tax=Prochlorococcus sp. MIT 1307 TaxID=3096219 RepID=UPI002A7666E5|nr:molecular chaperone DnaJ [Prochlorococcus sp. MIT 1307]